MSGAPFSRGLLPCREWDSCRVGKEICCLLDIALSLYLKQVYYINLQCRPCCCSSAFESRKQTFCILVLELGAQFSCVLPWCRFSRQQGSHCTKNLIPRIERKEWLDFGGKVLIFLEFPAWLLQITEVTEVFMLWACRKHLGSCQIWGGFFLPVVYLKFIERASDKITRSCTITEFPFNCLAGLSTLKTNDKI